MKLNRYHKQAIVNAIMLELPKVDEEKLKAEIQAKLVKGMSRACQNLYKKNPEALHKVVAYETGLSYRREFVVGDADYKEIVKPYQEAYRERQNVRSKLEAAIEDCTTRKQFVDRFPEFSKHAPLEHASCSTLPAVTNIVADLIKLGWEPTVTKVK